MSNQPPQRAKRPCKVGSCKDFASNGGYCDQHQDRIRKSDRERGTSHERGYDAKWREAREQFLSVHPLCVDCRKRGYITPANVVDHIKPHKGDKKLFWDETNWQALCKPCHDRKTASEDMGGWSHKQTTVKANTQSVNTFEVGEQVLAATAFAIECLSCNWTSRFQVRAIDGKTVDVEDADGFMHRLHHSHFKKDIHESQTSNGS